MPRFWEIDALRGFAVLAMVAFHFLFDLNYFRGINLFNNLMWFWQPGLIGALFIFVVGISLNLSKSNPWKRGVLIFSLGMEITLLTLFLFPTKTIWFGILHFIGLSTIIAQPFMKKNSLFFAITAIIFGIFLRTFTVSFPWLLWLGVQPTYFTTFDYYPLLPWFGILLLGLETGKRLYPNGKRIFEIKNLGKWLGIRQLCFLGQNALTIYLLHQPLLFLLISVL
jgi:uncharacterized membrane protein